MKSLIWKTIFYLILFIPLGAQAQTATYHLHKENSSTSGLFQLKTAGPDGSNLTLTSAELRNQANGEYLIKAFNTQANVPNAAGTIPSGSVVTFTLWMRKTANVGTMFPRAKLYLNSTAGTLLCTATGSTALTTTITQYTFTGTTSSAISMTAADRFYLWVGVNLTAGSTTTLFKGELRIEGTLNGNYDSLIIAPLPQPPPTISNLSPNSGVAGTSITITGTNFGATQGASTVKFNGVTATPTSWSTTSIATPVPSGASTGPVTVTVAGMTSNGVTCTVVTTGTISGMITRSIGGTTINGALIEALQSSVVQGSTNSISNGTYSINNLPAGTYDVRVSAAGFVTQTQTPVTVVAGGSTTVNVALADSPGAITGKITQSDGMTAVIGAAVNIYQGATNVGTATTNGTGDYAVSNLSAGSYIVEASASGYESRSSTATAVTAGASTTVNLSLWASRVTYVYEELGRLVGVVDPASDTANYHYDAAGNLLSISRQGSTLVSILEFTPNGGAIGTSVTIYGTGFSSVPALNTVTFNGVTATVTSASPTQLVTIVPSGATTGLIAVTTAAGNATSSSSFVVGAAVGIPTITGFSPTIGITGTSVTISGTNFESNPANNKPSFNGKLGQITTVTTTSIVTAAPTLATSGRLTVATPSGKATSSSDFYVSPPPYTVSDVAVTNRVALGSTAIANLSTANKIAILIFDGVAGHRLSVNFSNVTIGTSFCCGAQVTILRPEGTALVSAVSIGTSGHLIEPVELPVTGTYTILIDPVGSNTGSVSVTPYDVPDDVNTAIVPGGSTVSATITTPGQNANFTFNGTAGQRISLLMIGTLGSPGVANVFIYKPDSTALVTDYPIFGGDNFLNVVTLPTTGVYRIFLDPQSTSTGTMNFTLYDVPADITGTITPGGAAVTVNLTTPGQVGMLTFSGTAGQRISLKMSSVTITNGFVSLLQPDGFPLIDGFSVGTSGAFLDVATLFDTGTYTVLVTGGFASNHTIATGSMTLTLYDVPADLSGTVTIGGAAAPVTITTPGQNGEITFTGNASQQVTVRVTGNTMGSVTVSLLRPDGSTITSRTSSSTSFNLTSATLPAAGTYKITIDPNAANTGTLNISVTSP
jgi:YD repeat-containing protein